ncbi:MAG: ABC-2 type transport system permease protein [Planctomycetota bacterium]|jgi:ABC-2 type transport system permease protein
MNSIIALAMKDLRLIVRDKLSLFWILAFPLMYALFFGAIFSSDSDGGSKGISLLIIDESKSYESGQLIEQLAAHASIQLERESISADAADGKQAAVLLTSFEDAHESVKKGRRAAYLRIPSGYGDNPYAMFGADSGETSQLVIGIDPRRQAEAGFLEGILMGATFGSIQDRFLDKELISFDIARIGSEIAESEDINFAQKLVVQTFLGAVGIFVDQLDLEEDEDGDEGTADPKPGVDSSSMIKVVDVTKQAEAAPRSAYDVTFPQALVWGLMSIAMSFAITLVRERTTGTLLRLRIAPIGRAQILGGKALACFIGAMLAMTAILGFGWLALGVRFDSLPLLLLAMTATSLCFTGVMLTISVMGKTESAVAGSSWGIMMPFAMIGGGMIPLMAMPGWLIEVSVISPFKWAITAVEGAMWRGYDLSDMLVPCGVLLAIGCAFAAVGISIFRKVDN